MAMSRTANDLLPTDIRDDLKGNIKNYALDSNMEDAITYVNTQTQNN